MPGEHVVRIKLSVLVGGSVDGFVLQESSLKSLETIMLQSRKSQNIPRCRLIYEIASIHLELSLKK